LLSVKNSSDKTELRQRYAHCTQGSDTRTRYAKLPRELSIRWQIVIHVCVQAV